MRFEELELDDMGRWSPSVEDAARAACEAGATQQMLEEVRKVVGCEIHGDGDEYDGVTALELGHDPGHIAGAVEEALEDAGIDDIDPRLLAELLDFGEALFEWMNGSAVGDDDPEELLVAFGF